MSITRRGLLAGILGAAVAPVIITTPGILMPVRKIVAPSLIVPDRGIFVHAERGDDFLGDGSFWRPYRSIPRTAPTGSKILIAAGQSKAVAWHAPCTNVTITGYDTATGKEPEMPLPLERMPVAEARKVLAYMESRVPLRPHADAIAKGEPFGAMRNIDVTILRDDLPWPKLKSPPYVWGAA